MNQETVAFFDAKEYDREVFDEMNAGIAVEAIDIKYFESKLTGDTVPLSIGSRVLCAFVNDDLGADVIHHLHEGGVRLIALRCAGYNNVSLKEAFGKVHVVRVPAYSPEAVAEHALALMLSLNRKTHRAFYRTRDSNFQINGLMGFDMSRKCVGVIGTGRIGRVLMKILKGFEMKILAYDPFPIEGLQNELGFRYTSLEELYSASDIISLHCPLTKKTVHIIDDDAVSQMHDGVMLINTSRGRLVDTRALIRGLKSKKIGSAGLDVYEEESEFFFEDFSTEGIADDTLARLLTFPNVLITSHQAFFTKEAMHEIAATTLGSIQAFISGKSLDNEICYRCDKSECRKESVGRCF